MATVDYAKFRALAERLIRKFGGKAFFVTSTETGGSSARPGAVTEDEVEVAAAVVEYTAYERANSTNIQDGDRRAFVSAAAGSEAPTIDTKLRFKPEGESPVDLQIKEVTPLQPEGPGGLILFFDLRVRG